jgi:hypothetical protein
MELHLEYNEDHIKSFYNFIHQVRNNLGGVIMHLIIPPGYINLMYDINLEKEEEKDFYLLGHYHQFRFKVYVDNSLLNDVYLICNDGIEKIKVILHGPGSIFDVSVGTSTGNNEVKNSNPNPP